MAPSSPPKVRKCYFSLLCAVVHWIVFVILSHTRNGIHNVEIHPQAAASVEMGALPRAVQPLQALSALRVPSQGDSP